MLGLGTSIIHGGALSEIKLALSSISIIASDDENVLVAITVNDSDTQSALFDGVTQGTGNRINGTVELTVTNLTADPDKVGVDTFNVFQYDGSATSLVFLSLATSDITVSGAADLQAVDLTAGTFLDSEGADANLDASGSGERYGFSATLSISGFATSDAFVNNGADGNGISIDAA